MRTQIEYWKDIEGYEELYRISNMGRIKSMRYDNGRMMTPCPAGVGYLTTQLRKDKKSKNVYIHILVAKHFVDNPDNLKIVNHKNSVKTDNRESNLLWGTFKQGFRLYYDKGIKDMSYCSGSNNHRAKLKEKDIKEMKDALKTPYYGINNDLAKKYGVSASYVSAIKSGDYWKHVI